MALHITCACPTPIKGLGCIVICVKCEGGNAKTPQLLCLPHAVKNLVFCIACLSWVRGWVGGWVGVRPPPPPGGGVGHLSVCGYAKILGGWVPELTPPPPWLSRTLVAAAPGVLAADEAGLSPKQNDSRESRRADSSALPQRLVSWLPTFLQGSP